MKSRFALLALSIVFAVFSLALFFTVVEGSASGATDAAIGTRTGALMKAGPSNRQLADQRLDIRQDESLSLTEPISLYLPLVATDGYLDKSAERAAMMAINAHMNAYGWISPAGWGTDAYCSWEGVTCDGGEHVIGLSLRVYGNQLPATVPPEIGDLQKLAILRLNGTCGKTSDAYRFMGPLPPEIGNLARLRELDLFCNHFYTLPPQIGNLANLETLDVSTNHLTYLPAEIGNLVNLGKLRLGGNQLTSLPPEIGNLANLQTLSLASNYFTSLPPEIHNLQALQVLNLYGNQLTSLPPEIGDLASLQELILWYNKFTALPPEVGNLANLQSLNLSQNYFTFLPPEIGNLANLQTLNIDINHLASLPPEIGNLASLQELYLNYNYLPSLPAQIGNLANLQRLDLTYNQLRGPVPAFLSHLHNLDFLTLYHNLNLACWETKAARDWAVSLDYYVGPTCYFP